MIEPLFLGRSEDPLGAFASRQECCDVCLCRIWFAVDLGWQLDDYEDDPDAMPHVMCVPCAIRQFGQERLQQWFGESLEGTTRG